MQEKCHSETSVDVQQSTWRYISEDRIIVSLSFFPKFVKVEPRLCCTVPFGWTTMISFPFGLPFIWSPGILAGSLFCTTVWALLPFPFLDLMSKQAGRCYLIWRWWIIHDALFQSQQARPLMLQRHFGRFVCFLGVGGVVFNIKKDRARGNRLKFLGNRFYRRLLPSIMWRRLVL